MFVRGVDFVYDCVFVGGVESMDGIMLINERCVAEVFCSASM